MLIDKFPGAITDSELLCISNIDQTFQFLDESVRDAYLIISNECGEKLQAKLALFTIGNT